ncbi:MAG: class I SAM-dependent methyltransferase [Candidatus Thorarchaeota archaeon]
MVRKNRLPKFPDDYLEDKATDYDNSKWMERNQKNTTLKCIQYLFDEKLKYKEVSESEVKNNSLVLDLGCGTGYSSEIIVQTGFRVIGIDILPDMLFKAKEKKRYIEENKDMELILADINYLPIKDNIIEYIISVSSYNFITYGLKNYGEKVKLINETAIDINRILKSHGIVVIEFYPKDERELKMFNKSFINKGFEGYMVKKNPFQKSGQTFLLLKKKE